MTHGRLGFTFADPGGAYIRNAQIEEAVAQQPSMAAVPGVEVFALRDDASATLLLMTVLVAEDFGPGWVTSFHAGQRDQTVENGSTIVEEAVDEERGSSRLFYRTARGQMSYSFMRTLTTPDGKTYTIVLSAMGSRSDDLAGVLPTLHLPGD